MTTETNTTETNTTDTIKTTQLEVTEKLETVQRTITKITVGSDSIAAEDQFPVIERGHDVITGIRRTRKKLSKLFDNLKPMDVITVTTQKEACRYHSAAYYRGLKFSQAKQPGGTIKLQLK